MTLFESRPNEVAELWDQYRNDPRPFAQICKEHYLAAREVYAAFDRAGYPHREIKHPMTCEQCGKVFLQDDPKERFCSMACRKTRKRVLASCEPAPVSEPRNRKKSAKTKSIKDLAAEARAHGMTYGQCVAYLEGR